MILKSFGPPIVATPATLIRVAEAFKLPNWLIVTPGTNPAVSGMVTPKPTTAFLERAVIEFSGKVIIWSLPSCNCGLKNLPTPDVSELNWAWKMVNFKSSNWLGSHVAPFCDLNKDPKYGCWLIITCCSSGNPAVDMSTSPILDIQAL